MPDLSPSALLERFFRPMPAERLATLRVVICAYATAFAVIRAPYWLDVADLSDHRWKPVGILTALSAPPSRGVVITAIVASLALGIAATVGWHWSVTGPALAIVVLALHTYDSSWSQVFHTTNLLVLQLAVLAVAPAADRWAIHHRSPPDRPLGYGWPVRLMAALTVTTYFLAGVAKLRHGGIDWITGEALRNHVAADNLRHILLGGSDSPIGAWFVAHGWTFLPLSLAALAVELSAPVALFVRRFRVWWIIAAWCFHAGIVVLMTIVFPYQLLGVAFLPLLPVERVVAEVRRRATGRRGPGRWRPPRPATSAR